LPSQSTMSRRLRGRGVRQLLDRVEAELCGEPDARLDRGDGTLPAGFGWHGVALGS